MYVRSIIFLASSLYIRFRIKFDLGLWKGISLLYSNEFLSTNIKVNCEFSTLNFIWTRHIKKKLNFDNFVSPSETWLILLINFLGAQDNYCVTIPHLYVHSVTTYYLASLRRMKKIGLEKVWKALVKL